jgi:transcriptional regulator NrdR family protein
MTCPYCHKPLRTTQTIQKENNVVVRYRKCVDCGESVTSFEYLKVRVRFPKFSISRDSLALSAKKV